MTRPGKWTDLIAQAAALDQGESLRVTVPCGRTSTRYRADLLKMLRGSVATRTDRWSVLSMDDDQAACVRKLDPTPSQDLASLRRVKYLIEQKIAEHGAS